MKYMVFEEQTIVTGYRPIVGDVARVKTFAGSGIMAQVVGDERDGYRLKYPSPDGLLALRKSVPHWVGFKRVDKTLPQLAAARFWASGISCDPSVFSFQRWNDLPAFAAAWGDDGLYAFFQRAEPVESADELLPPLRLLKSRVLLENLARANLYRQLQAAAQAVLTERDS